MTKATAFPPADRTSQWYADRYPGQIFDVIEKLCWHTTEGAGWPTYQGGAMAPNLTVMPDRFHKCLVWRQHFPINMSSRALVHSRLQPTNGDHVVQVELIGTCATSGPGYYWPAAEDWALAGLAELVDFLAAEWAFPAHSTVDWRAPGAFGDGQRLTDAQYDAYRGILGHEHVPQNDHRDPGALNVARILQLTGTTTTAGEDDIVGDITIQDISDAAAGKIAKAIWERYAPAGKNLATWLGEIGQDVDWMAAQLAKVAATQGITLDTRPGQ